MTGRIGRDEMYRMLLAAVPEFAERWKRRQEAWGGDPRGLPDYPPLEEISRYAVYETTHRGGEPPADYRRTLETLKRRGDAFVKKVARELLADLDRRS